jgi:chemotaxis protein methyltransferase CheR
MTGAELAYLAKLVRERSGIVVTPDKGYLVESRLLPIARKWALGSLDELVARLKTRAEPALQRDVVETMTTTETWFFRDIKPFEQFRDVVLPRLLATRISTRTIRIWSAGCSSGQEPYSLAMILRDEASKLAGWTVELIATDLSSEMLAKARTGIYSQFEIQRGLPIRLLIKHFGQHGDRWIIDPALRDAAQFRQLNLLDDFGSLGTFDVIFCRNVLLYFATETKVSVLDRLRRQLAPDGVVYLGGAETVLGLTDRLQPVPIHRGMYLHASGAPPLRTAS